MVDMHIIERVVKVQIQCMVVEGKPCMGPVAAEMVRLVTLGRGTAPEAAVQGHKRTRPAQVVTVHLG